VDEMRRLRTERSGGGELPDEEEPDPAAKVIDSMAVRHEFVRKCRIGKLSGEQRATLFKFFWEEASIPDIAEALSAQLQKRVTAGNVSVWKSRALRTLADNLRHLGFR
jgi:hypothetical protein